MTIIPLLIVFGIIGVAVAIVGIFRPSLGLLVFLAIYFIQPGEIVPALAPFRLELTYGVSLFAAFLRRRASVLGPTLISNRILLSSLLLLGSACLSIPFAVWRGGAWNGMLGLAKLIVLLLLVSRLIETNRQMRNVLWLLVAVLLYFAGTGLFAYAHGDYYTLRYSLGNLDRARGLNSLAGGPNELAGLILALLPFVIALFRCTKNLLIVLLLFASGGLALTAMVLTGSRSAIIGLAFVVFYSVFTSRHKFMSLVGCLVLSAVIWFSMPSAYQQRFLTVKSYAAGGQLDDSNTYRLEIWQAGWRMFFDHPVLGVGASQFPTAFGTVYSRKTHGAWMNPHNLFLQLACELGIIGLIAFAYFLVQLIKTLRSTLRVAEQCAAHFNYQISLACGAVLLAVSVISVVGHSLYRPYWYLLGGMLVANRSILASKLRQSVLRSSKPAKLWSFQDEPRLAPGATCAGNPAC